MIIETFDLSKRFGAKQALKDVSLGVEPGDVLGLIGPNGAGKSTLIKLITGLIWPTEGYVTVGGFDVHREHTQAMRRLGAIIEWPSFHPDLTARQNLRIFSDGHGSEYEAKMLEMTKLVEMDRNLDRKVGTFSTGMKQRLGIALAMLPDSEVVILDEPTNGLDPGGIVEIRQIIREFNRRFGITVLVSSHLLGEIEQICDKVALIANGRLIASGTLSGLLTERPKLKLRVERVPQAAEALMYAFRHGELPALSLKEHDGFLWLENEHGAALPASEVNAFLLRAGFAVSHLSVEQQDLEKFFLEQVREAQ